MRQGPTRKDPCEQQKDKMRVCVFLSVLLSALLLLKSGLARPLQEYNLYDEEAEYGCNMPLPKICSYPELEVECGRTKQCDYLKEAIAAMPPFPAHDDGSIAIEMHQRPKKQRH